MPWKATATTHHKTMAVRLSDEVQLLMCCIPSHESHATIVEKLKNWWSKFNSTLGSRQTWKGHWLSYDGLVAVADRHIRFKWCASKLPDTMFPRMCRLSASCRSTDVSLWGPNSGLVNKHRAMRDCPCSTSTWYTTSRIGNFPLPGKITAYRRATNVSWCSVRKYTTL
jgi:hypothetical protein